VRAYHFEEHIDRSPEQVWAVLTDLSAAPRWRPMIASMETVDGGPLRLGAEVRIVADVLGKRAERVSRTTAFEENKRWELESGDAPQMRGRFDFRLEPDRSGTRVVATCDLTARALLPWLFLPIVARGERSRRVEMLANLKRLVEG
jgi:carbon monoxide dehydrogenase subunit G